MQLTVRIQRGCGQRLASGPLLRSGADLLTEINREIMMTGRSAD